MRYTPSALLHIFIFSVQAEELTLEVISEHWPPFIIQNSDNIDDISGSVTKKIHDILSPSRIDYTIKSIRRLVVII